MIAQERIDELLRHHPHDRVQSFSSAHVKVKSPESQLLEGQDVRMPNIFDIGKRYQTIGNRYREIFGGAR